MPAPHVPRLLIVTAAGGRIEHPATERDVCAVVARLAPLVPDLDRAEWRFLP